MIKNFRYCILSLLMVTLSLLFCTFTVSADIEFPNWISEQSEQYVQQLINDNSRLSIEEVKLIKQRLQRAIEEKNVTSIAVETARLVGNAPAVRERWIDLSFALIQKSKMAPEDWKVKENVRLAVFKVYQMSKTKEEKAEALLIFGSTLNPELGYEQPNYLDVFQEINTLVNLNQFRKQHSRVAGLMPFMFLKTRLNTDNVPPNVCFLFSHPLVKKDTHYEDYVSMLPKVEGAFKVNERELCFSPLKFGDNYDVTFKTGFPSADAEKLTAPQSVSFVVKDQTSRLSFANKAYVLMQNEEVLVPLSGVNVEQVDLKILRINDRDLNQALGGNMKLFLEPLWPYSLSEIENTVGERVWEGKMDFTSHKNQTITKQIPFSNVVKSIQPGIYVIQAQQGGAENVAIAKATQWLVVSDIGITAMSDREGTMTVQTRSLKSAEPLSNGEVHLIAYNNSVLAKQKMASDGIVRFEPAVTTGKGGNRPMMLLVYGSKGDFSLLDVRAPALDLSDRGVTGLKPLGPLNAFLYTEQGVYRANDTVHLNVLLRDEQESKGNLPLTFKFLRSDGIEVDQKTLIGDAVGHYAFSFPIVASARTGQWTILAYSDVKKDPVGSVQFTVQDFVPSRLTVSLKSEVLFLSPETPLAVQINGRYLFGANAIGLEGDAWLNVHVNPKPFTQFERYSFGLVDEQWTDQRLPVPFSPLDAEGKETLKVVLEQKPITTKPLAATLQVTLRDNGGRPEIGHLTLPIRLSKYSIGLKTGFEGKSIPEDQAEADIEVITVDPEGVLTAIELEYELYFEEQNYAWYQSEQEQAWQYKVLTDSKFMTKGTVNTQVKGPLSLKIPTLQEGSYRLEVRDPKTQIASSIRFYKGWAVTSKGNTVPDFLNLALNKSVYKEGETVEIKITAPFEGKALLSIANQSIIETQNIHVSKEGTIVKLKANPQWGTGVYCMVSAFRPLEKTQDQSYLPKRAIGVAYVGVDTVDKQLNIQFELPKEALPQQTIEVPVQVSARDKKQLSSIKLTVSAVDEGILKLTDFKLPDPEQYFFGQHQLSIDIRDLYGKLIDPIPGALGELRTGGDVSMLSRNLEALSKRSFKVVSLYAGEIALDQEGKGKIKIELPDFNGQLRIMGVAFDAMRLGSAEATLLVRDPVVIEGILPRFLAPNDESQLALSLHNVRGPAGEYTVEVKAEGNINLKVPEPIKVNLAEEGVFQTQVPIQATQQGEGRLTVQLIGPNIQVTRVYDLSIREAIPFATQITSTQLKPKESIKLSNQAIDDFKPGTESIQVNWSTQVPWDSAIISEKLLKYGYGCVEQTVSKGFAALLNSLSLTQTFGNLSEAQQADGGFGLWPGSQRDLWLTAYVVDFLQRSEAKGLQIPKFTLERSLVFLGKNISMNTTQENRDLAGTAYALYVLSKTDKVETGTIRYFYDQNYEKLDNVSLARIGSAFLTRQDDIRADKVFSLLYSKKEAMKNTPNNSPFGSALRDKAICILLLRECKIGENLLYSLTQTLGQEIGQSKELSTNEAAFVLLASSTFGQTAGNTLQINVNGVKNTQTSMSFSAVDFKKGITLQNLGKENVWQHVAYSGIPKEPPVAASNGFEISRSYYTLEGVPYTENKVSQGTELVVVLEGRATDTLAHQLLIVDLLPAGLEIESSISHSGNGQSGFVWLSGLSTPQYADPRDDRFVGSLLVDQKTPQFKLAYQVRAVTPGTYSHPALFVEDMYAPKFYAQTAASSLSVQAP